MPASVRLVQTRRGKSPFLCLQELPRECVKNVEMQKLQLASLAVASLPDYAAQPGSDGRTSIF